MRRLVAASVTLVMISSCAFLKDVFKGTDIGRTIADYEEMQTRCDVLATRPVPYEEEVQVGGAVALALADQTNGVYVEIAPELVPLPKIDPAVFAYKKLAPGTGPKTDLNLYVNRLGKSLAAGSSRPDIDWTFVVLDSPTANAFSAPGGYVFITTAMLKELKNEAQLAGVLAHEIGHVTGRHALKAYAESKVATCKIEFGKEKIANNRTVKEMKKSVSQAVSNIDVLKSALEGARFSLDKMTGQFINDLTNGMVKALTSKGNDQKDEFAADHDAFELMAFAGYDPKEFENVLRNMKGGGERTPHPTGPVRADKLKALREGEYKLFAFGPQSQPDNSKELSALRK